MIGTETAHPTCPSALEAADLVIADPFPRGVPRARKLGERQTDTMRRQASPQL